VVGFVVPLQAAVGGVEGQHVVIGRADKHLVIDLQRRGDDLVARVGGVDPQLGRAAGLVFLQAIDRNGDAGGEEAAGATIVAEDDAAVGRRRGGEEGRGAGLLRVKPRLCLRGRIVGQYLRAKGQIHQPAVAGEPGPVSGGKPATTAGQENEGSSDEQQPERRAARAADSCDAMNTSVKVPGHSRRD
jgi:hypothetical protein